MRIITIEAIKNEIRRLYDNQKPINVAKEYPSLYLKARKAFGSWKKALEESGVDYERARNRRKWSREKIIQEIKTLCLNGYSLRASDLKKEGMTYLLSSATYHFGSWAKAVRASSINYPSRKKKTS